MRVYAVMVTYRRPREAAATLTAIRGQTRLPDSLVIVDNAPQEGAPERFKALWGGSLDYLPMPENVGPAGGIAEGMRRVLVNASPDDWVLLIDDDDPPPTEDALERLAKFAIEMDDGYVAGVGLIGARMNWRTGTLERILDEDLCGPVPVDYVGGNQYPLYAVKALHDVGVFDSSLFFGFEELEYGLRLGAAGWTIVIDGDFRRELRQASGRTGLGPNRPSRTVSDVTWRHYYSQRNSVIILLRYKAWRALFWRVLTAVGKPIANLYRGPIALRALSVNIRGTWHGLTGKTGRTIDPGISLVPE